MYTPFFIMQNECKSSVRVQFRVQFLIKSCHNDAILYLLFIVYR